MNQKDVQNAKQAVREFANRARSELGDNIVQILFFGSGARKENTPDSDLDLLIVLNVCKWEQKKRLSEIAGEIDLKYDVVLSTVRYSRDLWEKPAIVESAFAKAVKREGIPL